MFLARLDATEELVAVKQVLIDGLSDRDMAGAIENEIKMISSLRHPNIVRYLGTHNCANNLNIILEYCANGSLRQMLQAEGPDHPINCAGTIRPTHPLIFADVRLWFA